MTEKTAQSIIVRDGKVVFAGSLEDAQRLCPDAETCDLGGDTIMPGFIDAHGHFLGMALSFIQPDLSGVADADSAAKVLADFVAENKIKKGEFVTAKNFEPVAEALTKELLDSALPDNPCCVSHISGHSGVFNSAALQILNAVSESGMLSESDYISAVQRTPPPSLEVLLECAKRAQNYYFNCGIVLAQEGALVEAMFGLYSYLIETKALDIEINAYATLECADSALEKFGKERNGFFKLSGVKIFLDGSPQLKTAAMLTPYLDGGYGSLQMSDNEVMNAIWYSASRGLQLLAHCNGDAACEQFIRCLEGFRGRLERPVMIHSQFATRSQLQRLGRLGGIPSFFVSHVEHWGDMHIENFGFKRASRISPLASTQSFGLPFTIHCDSPVLPPDILPAVCNAVCRVTKSGVLLGEEERISAGKALKSVTKWAAYQSIEENRLGRIAPGMDAKLILLEKNPLTVEPQRIKDIGVRLL